MNQLTTKSVGESYEDAKVKAREMKDSRGKSGLAVTTTPRVDPDA